MRKDVENWTVAPTTTIRGVMECIDRNALGIVIVVDIDGGLVGTVTDGDVRRAILAGRGFDEVASSIMNPSPLWVVDGTELGLCREQMVEKKLRQLPVVSSGKVVGLHLLDELSDVRSDTMAAVVMAGGLGSRLGEMTKTTPKPLIPVRGKPILEHIVEHLGYAGIRDVFITTRYLAEMIEDHFGDGNSWGVSIDYVREQERLGTAGALRLLEGRIQEPFLVMNGDLITNFRVPEMRQFHEEHAAAMTVAVRHYTMQVPFGVVEVEGVDIRGISEKPSFEFFVNAGIYIIDPRLLALIEPGRIFDMPELMDRARENGFRVVSYPIVEEWMDVGRPEDLNIADTEPE